MNVEQKKQEVEILLQEYREAVDAAKSWYDDWKSRQNTFRLHKRARDGKEKEAKISQAGSSGDLAT